MAQKMPKMGRYIYILRGIFEPFWAIFGHFPPRIQEHYLKNHTFWNWETKTMTKSIDFNMDVPLLILGPPDERQCVNVLSD